MSDTPRTDVDCLKCGKPVGNPVFTVCDNCWDAVSAETQLKLNKSNYDLESTTSALASQQELNTRLERERDEWRTLAGSLAECVERAKDGILTGFRNCNLELEFFNIALAAYERLKGQNK